MQYRAMDERGRVSRGRLDAADLAHLEQHLARMGLELISGNEVRVKVRPRSVRVGRRELIHLCFQLEQLLSAGVPVLDALADLRDSAGTANLRVLVAGMAESIEAGRTLSVAMEEVPQVFDAVFVGLVRAGESSGEVEAVLRNATANLKWQDEQAAAFRRLLTYPLAAGAVMLLVMVFLMTGLVPQLVSFITMMGQDVPAHTRALIAASDFFVRYWYLVLFAPPALLGACALLARVSPALRVAIDGLKLRAWGIGPVLRKIVLARFANSFALMYASGITVPECTRICEGLVGNEAVAKATRRVGRRIAQGEKLSDGFAHSGLFPPLVLRMLRVGENTGGLDRALRNVSYFYERDVQESMDRLQTMIAPAMTLVLGTLLFWIIVSVLGPIYTAVTSIDY